MSGLTSVLVIGSTGSVGKALCKELLKQKSEFKRIALLKNSAKSYSDAKVAEFQSLSQQGFEVVTGLYDAVDSYLNFDVVLIALGNAANHLQPAIIDAAITAGVRHFYPSEFGADVTYQDNWHQRYYRDKVLTRKHLETRSLDTPDLGWTYITVGRLTEWACSAYFGVDVLGRHAEIYGTELGRQSLISLDDVAAYTISSIRLPFKSPDTIARRRTLRFHGCTLTWLEIFGLLQAVTKSEFKVTYKPVQEAKQQEIVAREASDDRLEMQASHRLVQGSEGTVLPPPWDNAQLPHIELTTVDNIFQRLYAS